MHIPPFLKKVQSLVNSKLELRDFKASLLKLNYECPSCDPTHIVDSYPNIWWTMSDDVADDINPVDGVWEFLGKVSP